MLQDTKTPAKQSIISYIITVQNVKNV